MKLLKCKRNLIIIAMMIVASCTNMTKPTDPCAPFKYMGIKVSVPYPTANDGHPVYNVLIDSCEYIFVYYSNASWGAHKGNCKYCSARRLKETDSMLTIKLEGLSTD
jgi:hypothetical protein